MHFAPDRVICLIEKHIRLASDDVARVVDLRSQCHGRLIKLLKVCRLHLIKVFAVNSFHELVHISIRQPVRVVRFCFLVHGDNAAPCGVVLVRVIHGIRGRNSYGVDTVKHTVDLLPEFLRSGVAHPLENLQLLQRVLLAFAQLFLLLCSAGVFLPDSSVPRLLEGVFVCELHFQLGI